MEPNGATKGVSLPTASAPPAASSASAPEVVPVLPQNMAGMVPLSAIIHRITNEAFADLTNLSELLPPLSDSDKKLHILEYALSKREQFIKLLVLTKWAKSANKFQQCQNIVGFLRHENELFTRAVGGLFETYRLFGRARVRNFDIPTAIDVLTTGTYQRMPSRIKQVYVEEERPSGTDMAATLEKLDDVIRMRLLCDELVPPPMKYTIGKGKAKFVVPNEFEVTLTVSGPGSPQEIPWRIVGINILVKPVGGSFQGLGTSLSEGQMRAITAFAQKEMESSNPANGSQFGTVAAPGSTVAPANQSLLRLYDYLHMLALQLLIELVYIQALNLLRSGWTDNRLRVEVNAARSVVRLVYWNSAPQSTQPPASAPAPKRRASASPSTPSSTQRDLLQGYTEHYLEIRIEERPGPKSKIPEGLAGALVDPKVLGYPKAYIKVVWSQVVKGVVAEQESDAVLELNPSNLRIEQLLLKAVNMHAGQVMQEFYDRLCSHIDNMKTQVEQMDGAYISKDDVQLTTLDFEEQQGATGTAGLSGPQALLVRLKCDRWIRVRIDVRTGRVVVREVGRTGEGIDPVIAAFQARLNESANNIVDALISLRFSMAIVELESQGILLGLQPYRRLALAKQDASQFGTNIHQLLFLQYPQHPQHYLVVGVMNQKFCVWLIEVEREVGGVWLTLKSIQTLQWQALKRWKAGIESDYSPKSTTVKKRKSVQFDIEDEEPQEAHSGDQLTIDGDVLSKLEALCRVRICLNAAKTQLREHGIAFHYLKPPPMTHDADAEQGHSSWAKMVPLLRLEPGSISTGVAEGLFLYVGAKLTGWWDSQRETCNFIVQAKFVPGTTPSGMASGPLDAGVHYAAKTGTLTFTYKARGMFVQQFKDDWEKIVRMLKIIRQLHAPTLSNPHIQFQTCHLHHVKLSYFGRYTLTLKWTPASAKEKRSSTGVLIPAAPRFRQGAYEIELSEVESGKAQVVNPHHRMKYFLQDMINSEGDLHSLMNTLVQTCSILEVLDRLESSVKEDSMGMKLLSVVPRAAHHVRVVYGSKYALDIRAYSRTHLSMFDASFPSESYGSSLPPPPAPAISPLLVTTGRLVPPTTKGHLHYGPIPNLQGVIGGIDVEKADGEYDELQSRIAATGVGMDGIIGTSGGGDKAGAVAVGRGVHQEAHDLLPLPNGLICSRSMSGRVLYRIAKHVEGLLQSS
ncbi:mediator complex subunit [Dissophora globulifera]|uniref:Mediator of RNA polymerase II transcription subunit 14 n=1 Tax=Dissophora globulifera TaxID=979702 RepID=A0A9P6RDJ8_9FUNG|nr:mediator complex subunit [Dissophora globulifera]